MTGHLNDYKVLTFDCYGTLIDWETGIWDALQPVIMQNRRSDITRETGLASFALHESAQEKATPDLLYPQLLERVHAAIALEFDMATTAQADAEFGQSVAHGPAFPERADALRISGRQRARTGSQSRDCVSIDIILAACIPGIEARESLLR